MVAVDDGVAEVVVAVDDGVAELVVAVDDGVVEEELLASKYNTLRSDDRS